MKKFYSNSRYVPDNGNGYDYDTRDCLCGNCGRVLYAENKYRDVTEHFAPTIGDVTDWKYCHYCGVKFE